MKAGSTLLRLTTAGAALLTVLGPSAGRLAKDRWGMPWTGLRAAAATAAASGRSGCIPALPPACSCRFADAAALAKYLGKILGFNSEDGKPLNTL